MKVAVCIPIYGDAKAGFAISLAAMMYRTAKDRPELGIELFRASALISAARTGLVSMARKWGADFILFLDADQEFPADTLTRLLDRNLPMVAANYAKRVPPHDPVSQRADGRPMVMGKGIEEARFVGLGVCLINARLFDDLEQPWFATPHLGGDRFMGEDVFFSGRIRDAGGKIYVDHDLQVGHIGERTYTMNDAIENAARAAFRASRIA